MRSYRIVYERLYPPTPQILLKPVTLFTKDRKKMIHIIPGIKITRQTNERIAYTFII